MLMSFKGIFVVITIASTLTIAWLFIMPKKASKLGFYDFAMGVEDQQEVGLKYEPKGNGGNQTTVSVSGDVDVLDLSVDTVKFKVYKNFRAVIRSSPVSKDVVIHRVYYDDRKRKGHKNQTVFFIDVKWTLFKSDWIVGCGVHDLKAKKHSIRIPAEWWWVGGFRRKVPFKYEHLILDCYDLPVNHGDRAFLIYKTRRNSPETIVESDYPVVIPEQNVVPNDGYDITIVACIKANSMMAPFLGDIIHYQKLIGVDHVSLITLSSFIKDGGLNALISKHPDILHYFTEGYLSIDMWKEWYNETIPAREIRLWSESIRKVACAYNYRGTYDYAIPIDSDDFFTPRVKGKTNIKYYLKKYCHKHPIGSCMLKWITYYPDFCGLNDIPSDGNVTKALKSTIHKVEKASKSIHKTQALLDATFHDAKTHSGGPPNLMPGYQVVRVNQEFCAISHLRVSAQPKSLTCNI